MSHSPVVSFKDPDLEALRDLLLFKEALRAPGFVGLVDEIDNDAVQSVFRLLSEDAEDERERLRAIVGAWTKERSGERPDPSTGMEPSYRDIVVQWRGLAVQAAERARRLAAAAPDAALRMRLEALAARDEAHADLLQSLL